MNFIHAWFCDDCGHTHREPVSECERCASTDITRAPAYASVEYDDVADDKRLAEIRAGLSPAVAQRRRAS